MRAKFRRKGRIPALALISGTVFIVLLSGPASSPAQTSGGFEQSGKLASGLAWLAQPAGGIVNNRQPYYVHLKGFPKIYVPRVGYASATHYNVRIDYGGGPGKQFERKATKTWKVSTRFQAHVPVVSNKAVIWVQLCWRTLRPRDMYDLSRASRCEYNRERFEIGGVRIPLGQTPFA